MSNLDTDAPAFAQLHQQLSALAGLQRRIGSATIMDLIAVRGEVAAVVTQAQSAAASAQSGSGNGTVQLQLASGAARQATKDFLHSYYDKHEFDEYLEFASKRDAEEFRRREGERRTEIEKALALNTPEGNLRASSLSIDQLKDAGAHGASRSPRYQQEMTNLTSTETALAAQVEKSRAPEAPTIGSTGIDATKPEAGVSPELLASLRSAGVLISDDGQGHGVSQRDVKPSSSRGPA